jgi:hypothetical protein
MKPISNHPNRPNTANERITININNEQTQPSNTQAAVQPVPVFNSRENTIVSGWLNTAHPHTVEPSREEIRQQNWNLFSSKIINNQGFFKTTDHDWSDWTTQKHDDFLEWAKVTPEFNGLVFDGIQSNINIKKALVDILRIKSALQTLQITQDEIDDEGAKNIADALKTNSSLHKLKLAYNKIGDEGAQALADMLKINTTLHTLLFAFQEISDEGVKAIANALKVNTALGELQLNNNDINDTGAEAIADTLKINTSLHALQISNNDITDTGTKALADALKLNTSIQTLNLRNNLISDNGAIDLAMALKTNTTLTDLNLWKNEIKNSGLSTLITALKINTSIKSILFQKNSYESDSESSQSNEDNELSGLTHRNKLWPVTHPAGMGMSKMIDQQYPELINTFPPELGNLIAENMLWVGKNGGNSTKDFQQIESNLNELMYGAAVRSNTTYN